MMKKKNWWFLIAAFVVFLILCFMPTPAGLTLPGQRALALFAFAIILWVTEAISYTVSAALLVGLAALALGFAPKPDAPGELLGTGGALRLALGGFATPALALVAGALFIAAAMKITGLHKRLALNVMARIGTRPSNLVLGIIIVSTILAFFVPSATARAGAIVPIIMGIVQALNLKKDSKLSALLLLTAILSISFWNIGIRTAAAQNQVAIGFIQETMHLDVTWIDWLIYAGPWALVMNLLLWFLAPRFFQVEEIPEHAGEAIHRQLEELGPMQADEKKLAFYSILLLLFWSTEGLLHSVDATTITLVVFSIMLLPKLGVFSWQDVQEGTAWGTLVVFAVGISLGTILLNTGGAAWLADATLGHLGLERLPLVLVIALLSLMNILIHLGFASATSLASAFIPIVISLMGTLNYPTDTALGMVLIQQFVISFGFLLPVSAPQNMLAYGTGGYTAKELMKIGLPVTVIGYLLILVMAVVYWPLVGLL